MLDQIRPHGLGQAIIWHLKGDESNDDAASHRLFAKELPSESQRPDGTILDKPGLFPIACDHLGHAHVYRCSIPKTNWSGVKSVLSAHQMLLSPEYNLRPENLPPDLR